MLRDVTTTTTLFTIDKIVISLHPITPNETDLEFYNDETKERLIVAITPKEADKLLFARQIAFPYFLYRLNKIGSSDFQIVIHSWKHDLTSAFFNLHIEPTMELLKAKESTPYLEMEEQDNEIFPIQALDTELLIYILNFCPITDFLNLILVSKEWHRLLTTDFPSNYLEYFFPADLIIKLTEDPFYQYASSYHLFLLMIKKSFLPDDSNHRQSRLFFYAKTANLARLCSVLDLSEASPVSRPWPSVAYINALVDLSHFLRLGFDENQRTPLFYIKKRGQPLLDLIFIDKVTQLCFDQGYFDERGLTHALLKFAAILNQPHAVTTLLCHHTTEKLFHAHAIFNSAIIHNHIEIVKLLLIFGASPNVCLTNELTLLQLASKLGHVEIAQLLLEYNANKDASDKNGLTPLHFAASGGHFKLVNLLLNHGANANLRTNTEDTYWDTALKHDKLFHLLPLFKMRNWSIQLFEESVLNTFPKPTLPEKIIYLFGFYTARLKEKKLHCFFSFHQQLEKTCSELQWLFEKEQFNSQSFATCVKTHLGNITGILKIMIELTQALLDQYPIYHRISTGSNDELIHFEENAALKQTPY